MVTEYTANAVVEEKEYPTEASLTVKGNAVEAVSEEKGKYQGEGVMEGGDPME